MNVEVRYRPVGDTPPRNEQEIKALKESIVIKSDLDFLNRIMDHVINLRTEQDFTSGTE